MNLSASNIGRRSSSAVSWKSENHDDMGMALSAEWKIEIISIKKGTLHKYITNYL